MDRVELGLDELEGVLYLRTETGILDVDGKTEVSNLGFGRNDRADLDCC